MTKIAQQVSLAGIELRRRSAVPLLNQLAEALRTSILQGQLRPGGRLPSTRLLATEFGVSRNTVMNAYAQLLNEGYLEARVGSGTCVARSLPNEVPPIIVATPHASSRSGTPRRNVLSLSGRHLARAPTRVLSGPGVARPFASGQPDVSLFPFKLWARLLARRWRRPERGLTEHGDAAGYRPLREAIAAYLRTARAVRCEADQVLVVNGSQQALDLSARILLRPGDKAVIEEPGYPGARTAFAAAGAALSPLPVDEDGADIRGYRGSNRRPRLIFVTPSHQYPLGVTMTVARRLALLDWARRSGAWILEDDYDSEFRYRARPLPSMQGLDGTGQVIYMGSFSKTLFASLRLGFLVLPPSLVEPFQRARAVVDGHSPITEQVALAEFIEDGHFGRHIRRMRALYEERQTVLLEAAQRNLDGLLDVRPADGGMHLLGWLPKGVADFSASRRAADFDVVVKSLSLCSMRPRKMSRGGLLLGYAALTPEQIRDGAERLAKALARG